MFDIILYDNSIILLQNLYGSIIFGIISSIFLNETDISKRNEFIIYSSSTLFYLCEMERSRLY